MAATKDQVAQIIVGQAKARNHTRDECLGELSALYQESEWDETVWDGTHTTYGVAQQDGSYPNRFQGAAAQVKAFFDKLDVWRAKPGASSDIWLNICWMQQRPNWPSAQYWSEHGRQAYLTEIKSRIATVTPYLDKYWPPTTSAPPPTGVPMSDPIWLPDVLRAAGLQCDIYPGAFDRGHGDFGEIWGVVCHHTGSFGETPRGIAEHPSLGLASQLYLSRDGKYTLCGVGVAWHAGAGSYPGLPANNANFRTIGIEGANDGGGRPGAPHHQPWSNIQYDAYVVGVGAILAKLGQPSSHSIDHKEWAGAAQGKWDRGGIDPNIFRSDVQNRWGGKPPVILPPAQPPAQPPGVPVEYANFGVIRQGDQGIRVVSLQTRLQRNYSRIVIDGYFGPDTKAKVLDYQRLHPPLVVDGQVGPATAAMLKLVG